MEIKLWRQIIRKASERGHGYILFPCPSNRFYLHMGSGEGASCWFLPDSIRLALRRGLFPQWAVFCREKIHILSWRGAGGKCDFVIRFDSTAGDL